MTRVVAGAALSTCVVATVTATIAGGGATDVAAATALVTYMVASAVLLVRAEERWLAMLLLPGALASTFVLARSERIGVFPHGCDRHGRRVVRRPWSAGPLDRRGFRTNAGGGRFIRRDVLIASEHLLHGVICGVAVSLVVIRLGHAAPEGEFGRVLLPVPLLAALGVMEWQLHTFRWRMARLINTLGSIDQFPVLARRVFHRSLAICVAAIVIPAIAVVVAVRVHGDDIPVAALAVQCALGAVFFADLIMVLLDRLDVALRSWLFGIATGIAACVVSLALTGAEFSATVLPAAAVLVAVALASLLLHARQVVAAAMNH